MKTITTAHCGGYVEAVAAALDAIGAGETLAGQKAVLLKPNLVNASAPPITTPAPFCEAVIAYVRSKSRAEIVVAEGCGDAVLETDAIFAALGYDAMAARAGVELLDLNHAELVRLENAACPVFPELYLPKVAFTHFVVSLPVLKAHSLAGVTGALKNMMGFAPPKLYAGVHGSWKKAAFHGRMQDSLIDLLRYRAPDLAVMDASRGLADYHLGGRELSPQPGLLVAGFDPWEVDKKACDLLGLDWRGIRHVAEKPG